MSCICRTGRLVRENVGLALAGARVLVGERELDSVVANILRPTGDEIAEAAPVVSEKGARGFLESGQVARDSRHKSISGLLRGADAIAVAAVPARLIYQLPHGDGSSARL